MSDHKTVLVLGGGVGGLVAANRLRKLLSARHRVVLIDRERQAVFQPSLLWVAVGDRTPEAIQRPLAMLVRKGVEIRIGTVEKLDAETRTVRVEGQTRCCRFSCRLTQTLSGIAKGEQRQITLSVNDLKISCRTSYSLSVA